MMRTLFHIPNEIGGLPVFGFGLLLAAWAAFSVGLLAWLARRRGFDAEVRGYLPILLLIAAAIVFLLPRMADEHGVPIRGYGTLLVVAVCVGTILAARRARQMGIHPDVIYSMTFWVFIWGIVGARAFYVIEYWGQFRGETPLETLWAVVNVAEGGLVVYGAVLGGAGALLIMMRRRKLPALAMCDMFAAPLAFGIAIGRLGCLMNGCCYGGTCELPWAISFPAGSPPYLAQLERGEVDAHGLWLGGGFSEPPIVRRIDPQAPVAQTDLRVGDRLIEINGLPVETAGQAYQVLDETTRSGSPLAVGVAGRPGTIQWTAGTPPRSLPIHPTQIYSAINGFVLGLFTWFYYPYRRRDGEVAALAITLYPITRFLLEVIRTDEADVFGTGMSISQNVSILILVGAVVLWIYVLRGPAGSVLPRRSAVAS